VKSTRVKLTLLGQGVAEVSCLGLVSHGTMPLLRMQVRALTLPGWAAVVRLDTAVVTLATPPGASSAGPPLSVPVAWVVHAAHYEMALKWAELLAQATGYARVVFVAQNLDLARSWAADRAAVAIAKLLPLPGFRLPPGPLNPSGDQTIERLTKPLA
jgi:hypothetical protein